MAGRSPGYWGGWNWPQRLAARAGSGKGSALLDPLAAFVLRPVAALDPVAARQQFPRQPRALERRLVEQDRRRGRKLSAASRHWPSAISMLRARLGASALVDSRIGWRASSAPPAMPCGRKLAAPWSHSKRSSRASSASSSATISSRASCASSLSAIAGDHLLERRPAKLVEIDPHRSPRSGLEHVRDELVEQAHAVAGRALVVGRARPCPTRPCRRCRDAPSGRRRRRSAG